jgi:hypothetical protein
MTGMGFNDPNGWPTTGVTHTRIWDSGATWNKIHLGVDVYNWTSLDLIVEKACSMGMKITYVIGATPLWLAKYPSNPGYAAWLGPGSNSMPYDIDEFNKFAWNLATRYLGRIQYYEMWNEPQLEEFLYPYEASETNCLAQMTLRAYSTIKSIDSSAYILAASVLPRSSSGGMAKAQLYLDSLESHGWNVDAFTTHIYPENGKGAEEWYSMVVDCQSSLAKMNPPTSKLWVTETYFNLLGDVIPEASAPSLIDSTYAFAATAGIMQLYWYGWDQGENLGGLQLSANSSAWREIDAIND